MTKTEAGGPRRIGIVEVRLRTNASTSTINRWVKHGRFPRPHYLGTRRCWFEQEIAAWEAQQMSRAGSAA
jgi:predicted DNA-binding transcriptional regulator AlpA